MKLISLWFAVHGLGYESLANLLEACECQLESRADLAGPAKRPMGSLNVMKEAYFILPAVKIDALAPNAKTEMAQGLATVTIPMHWWYEAGRLLCKDRCDNAPLDRMCRPPRIDLFEVKCLWGASGDS